MTEATATRKDCPPIMYVCEPCSENHPEGCGHYDRENVRKTPAGAWCCEDCYLEEREDGDPDWSALPIAPDLNAATPPATETKQ